MTTAYDGANPLHEADRDDWVHEVAATWWAEHRRTVWLRLVARTGDRHLSDDLLADTFVRAIRYLRRPDARIPDEPAAWLYTTAKRLLIDHTRRSHVRSETPWSDVPDDATPWPGPPVIFAPFEEIERREAFYSMIAVLPPPQRLVMELRDLHGMSTRETAEVMGRSDQAIRSLRHKAVRTLREHFAETPDTPGSSTFNKEKHSLPLGGEEMAQELA